MAVNGINNINTIASSPLGIAKVKDNSENAPSFVDYLKDAINKVNNAQLESEKMTNDFAAGRTENIHDVMIAAEKAEVALQFTMQIRNKVLDAYQEIMRMQI